VAISKTANNLPMWSHSNIILANQIGVCQLRKVAQVLTRQTVSGNCCSLTCVLFREAQYLILDY